MAWTEYRKTWQRQEPPTFELHWCESWDAEDDESGGLSVVVETCATFETAVRAWSTTDPADLVRRYGPGLLVVLDAEGRRRSPLPADCGVPDPEPAAA